MVAALLMIALLGIVVVWSAAVLLALALCRTARAGDRVSPDAVRRVLQLAAADHDESRVRPSAASDRAIAPGARGARLGRAASLSPRPASVRR